MLVMGIALGWAVSGFAYDKNTFKSEEFHEFTNYQRTQLLEYLRAATNALVNAYEYGISVDDLYDEGGYHPHYINVRITLRNVSSEPWTISSGDEIYSLISFLACGHGKNAFTSLQIEANPDYFPREMGANRVKNAIRSFEQEGAAIVISPGNSPLAFSTHSMELKTQDNCGYKSSHLFGLTFEGSTSGAIVMDKALDLDSSSYCICAVRLINCTFRNCKNNYYGGAVRVNAGIGTIDMCSERFKAYDDGEEVGLSAADEEGIAGSHIYHCTFDGCQTTGNYDGGAIYGNRDWVGTVITDCTFTGCRARYGGAVYNALSLYRCTFLNCTATQSGGACYYAYSVVSCLFKDCSGATDGGAANRGEGYDMRIGFCIFENCTASGDKVGVDVGESDPFVGCLYHKTTVNSDADMFGNKAMTDAQTGRIFLGYDKDFHIKPGEAGEIVLSDDEVSTICTKLYKYETEWPLYIGQDEWPQTYDYFRDRDGKKFVEGSLKVAGCYRYYKQQEWDAEQERKKPCEWKSMNPLEVTVSEDIVNPRDGKISFREAWRNLELCRSAPASVCADQWPRITFAMNGSREVVVTNCVMFNDANRPADSSTGLTYRQPFVIDGDARGVTIRNGGSGASMLELKSAGVFSNVLFRAGSLTIGDNQVPAVGRVSKTITYTNELDQVVETKTVISVMNDRHVSFENCAFEAGAHSAPLVRSLVGNLRFRGCTFSAPNDGLALGAVEMRAMPAWTSRLDCCTFTGFSRAKSASYVLSFLDGGGELRLVNCTFGENEGVPADLRVEDVGATSPGRIYALNCLFGDGADSNTVCLVGSHAQTAVHCPLWPSGRYAPERKGELMVNFAADDFDEAFDSRRITQLISGIMQYSYKPKHGAAARYGRATYDFGDGVVLEKPPVDIFRRPQEGPYHSMGSFYVDDKEYPSVAVTTGEDVTDLYDDEISLREAIAYGGVMENNLTAGVCVKPTFDRTRFTNDVVALTVTGAIQVAANNVYQNFALQIEPGKDPLTGKIQKLSISSATNSTGGAFLQESGTKLLKFSKVTFDRCGTTLGSGGVLETAGRYRFDDCAFVRCWTADLKAPDCTTIVQILDGVLGDIRAAGITTDFGLPEVYQVTNVVRKVEATKRKIAEIVRRPDFTWSEVRAEVNASAAEISQGYAAARSAIDTSVDDLNLARWKDSVYDERQRTALTYAYERASSLQNFLDGFGTSAEDGRGGAICAKSGAEGLLLNSSASGCFALGAGGVIASAGDLIGVNLTFCRNDAESGGAVYSDGDTCQFASVAFVDNVSKKNGALDVVRGTCGLVNGIVIGNASASGAANVTVAANVATNVQHSLCDETLALDRVFETTTPSTTGPVSNDVEKLFYPLKREGLAVGTGAYVFFSARNGARDCREADWFSNVLYSTDPNGRPPNKPMPLFGSSTSYNSYLLYDQLGKLIKSYDGTHDLPASMGPVPRMNVVEPSAVVTTTLDYENTLMGVTSLRVAAEYAMSNDVAVTFADGLFASGATPVFELTRQIDVPKGAALRIVAGSGRTVELRPAEAARTNKFFTVFPGGSLAASGLTLQGGFADVDAPYMQMQPTNPNDGGAVQGFGPMAFTNCIFRANTALGHGGAIWSCGGLTLSGCLFETNRAGFYGGAVYSIREQLDVSGSTFLDNVAQKGGAIYVFGSTNAVPQIQSTDIVRNVAREVGGGLYLGDDEFLQEQELVEIKATDVRLVGNTDGNGGQSDNVFVGDKVVFDPQTLNRPPVEFTKVAVVNGVTSLVLDEEKAKPVLGDFELGLAESDSAAVSVRNVVPGLYYGLGRAETPAGPYVVDRWVRAKPGEAVNLTAPKAGASGFYKVMARE